MWKEQLNNCLCKTVGLEVIRKGEDDEDEDDDEDVVGGGR